ncbi:MAG: patatin/phospholipase-related protein [Moraxellaceae bacterium]|jgi:NTE family protein|nr:patatin/phospholipase-related protein [Moraxellaceae bacterium]
MRTLAAAALAFVVAACSTPPVAPVESLPVAPVVPPPQPREPVIAVALGGGGAKGFAHIGVLKVLESHGIKPRIVTGTSAGSFVGSMYASGKSPFDLQDIAFKLEESDIRDLTFSSQGFIEGRRLQDFVNRQVGNRTLQQFPIRFAAIATDLDTGRKAAFITGNAGQAVRASCSIPNVFVPAVISGKRYADGGLVSPVPVSSARDLGADIVIAVDISARPKAGVAPGMFSILDQTLNIMALGALERELAGADVVISPRVLGTGVAELEARHKSILEGERAAQSMLPAIQQALDRFRASPAALQPPLAARF